MAKLTARVLRALDRSSGRLIHAGWLLVAAIITLSAYQGLPVSAWSAAAWFAAAVAAPGLIGVAIAGETALRHDAARLALALSWTLPGFAAFAAFGTVFSAAALLFLAGPAALAAAGGPREARLSAVVSASAFLLAAAAAAFGPVTPSAAGFFTSPEAWSSYAGFLALAGLVSRGRLAARLEAATRALARARPAAEGFVRAPQPLLALNPQGEILAASRAVRRAAPGAPRRLEGLPAEGLACGEEIGRAHV